MQFEYKQLNGRPRCVKMRVIRYSYPHGDTSVGAVKEVPIRTIPIFCDSEESSDIYYTLWGDVERVKTYDYTSTGKPFGCGSYLARFDKHNNIVYSDSDYTQRWRVKTHGGKPVMETEKHKYSNIYVGDRLAWRVDSRLGENLCCCLDGLYVTTMEYDENGRVVKEFGEYGFEKEYKYDGDRLVKIDSFRDGEPRGMIRMEYDAGGVLRRRTIEDYGPYGDDHVMRITYKDGVRYFIEFTTDRMEKIRRVEYGVSHLDEHGEVVTYNLYVKLYVYRESLNRWRLQRRRVIERTYTNTYDEQGNWTRRDFYLDGKKRYAYIRDIEYY